LLILQSKLECFVSDCSNICERGKANIENINVYEAEILEYCQAILIKVSPACSNFFGEGKRSSLFG